MAKTSNRSQEINTYEESRKQRLQENLKRFEDLGILKISKSLSEVTDSQKKSPQHPAKPRLKRSIDVLELRRSSRPRNLVASYSVAPDIRPSPQRKRSKSSSWKSYLGRPADEVKFASNEQRARAFRNAEMLQSNLGSKNPCFIKSMVRSHVYSCFWLGLPSKFSKDHLPSKDVNMILEDEAGSKSDALYIGSRQGLSGGWRGFALDHKLDDGDALVFELFEPNRFKIYIVRASSVKQENTKNVGGKEKNGAEKGKRNTRAAKVTVTVADEGFESDSSFILNKNVNEQEKQNGEAEKTIETKVDEGLHPERQLENVSSQSKVRKGKKGDNGKRAASKNQKQKIRFSGESEVTDAVIEAEVKEEKIVGKGNGSASSKKQKKVDVTSESEVKEEITVENTHKSVSIKPQQRYDGNKLSAKKGMSRKLFRRKVY